MARKPRDYAREYATRKASARRAGYSGVRAYRNFRRDVTTYQAARGLPMRLPTQREITQQAATSRRANPPTQFGKYYVMSHWMDFFDTRDEAVAWYDEQ